jgi:hypothetical protein
MHHFTKTGSGQT